MRSPSTTFHRSPEHCVPTKYARGSCRSHRDAEMLFCPSFTQSERYIHTDHPITRLRRVEPATCCSHDGLHSHVVGKRGRERVQLVQVRCSDLVGSDLPQGGESKNIKFDVFHFWSSPWRFGSSSSESDRIKADRRDSWRFIVFDIREGHMKIK